MVETPKTTQVKLEELRKSVHPSVPILPTGWDAAAGLFLAGSLVCSVDTAFARVATWPAAAAIALLGLSLFCWRSAERKVKN
jgi:hypothetical protein